MLLASSQVYPAGTHEAALEMAMLMPRTYLCVIQQNGQQKTIKLMKTK